MQLTQTPFFRPTLYRSESFGSGLLRLSGSHCERPSVYLGTALQKTYDTAKAVRAFSHRCPNSLKPLIDTEGWNPPDLYKELVSGKSHKKWFNFNHAKVCPACAEEGHLPLYHDLESVSACAKHGLSLVSACPKCEQPVTWNRRGLARCSCYASLDVRVTAEYGAVKEARLIKQWLHTDDREPLETYINLKRRLSKRYGMWPCAREALMSFMQGNIDPLSSCLRTALPNNSILSIRALVAPLSATAVGEYNALCKSLEKHMAESNSPTGEMPANFFLTRSELIYVLRTTWKVVDGITKESPEVFKILGKERYGVNKDGLNTLLGALGAEPIQKPGQSIRELVTLTKVPAAVWVQSLINGEYVVTASGESLLDISLSTSVSANDTIPEGYVTMPQAAQYLELYPEAVRKMIKSGLLEAELQLNHNRRYIFPLTGLETFTNTYVTGPQLAVHYNYEPRRFAERLIAAGATPVAGPSIDGCNIYVFHREELEDESLIRYALSLKTYSQSGRRAAGTPSLDTTIWATATEAADYLNISLQKLSYLEGLTPLTKATPLFVPIKNTRYYRWDCVRATKDVIDTLVPAKKLASSIGVTEQKLLRRAGRIFKSPSFYLDGTTYLSAANANKLKYHFKRYWCADIAAKFLGSKRFDINNWRRLGHLDALDNDHPGFIEGIHLYDNKVIRHFIKPSPRHSLVPMDDAP
jgi:hypothetical protein